MGPVDENYYFDPTMNIPPGQEKRVNPIRPDEEAAKLVREKLEKKGLITLMTGPDAARLDKKEEHKKDQKAAKKKGDEKKDQSFDPPIK